MKFTDNNMDFEIPRAKLGNYFYGNIIMPKSRLLYFSFPAELQVEDFKLQKLTFDKEEMTYSFADFIILDNTYKKDGFFESYGFVSDLDVGYYRLISGTLYSVSLFDVRNIDTAEFLEFLEFTNNNGDIFVDNTGAVLVEPI